MSGCISIPFYVLTSFFLFLSFHHNKLNMPTHQQLIEQYSLQPHPEGGWYKQTYKSNEYISADALPERFGGSRAFSTAIYFVLDQGNFSAFHRIKSDECWHFYAGDPLLVYVLQPDGALAIIHLGNDIAKRQMFQYVVPANCWFASKPAPGSTYCFVGCTVAPGFDFADFELADAPALSNLYPQHESIIRQLCR
jgi:predicted cupin superfamily sugar epimerase